jgi:multidrug resistance efflux pump
MLNISDNKVPEGIENKYSASHAFDDNSIRKSYVRILMGVLIFIFLVMFFPWTQNIQGRGEVTTLRPDQRPQTIHSTIAGRVEKWFVREGQLVKKGDTIVYLSETKPEYIDPELLNRTQEQIQAKAGSTDSYEKKVEALERQLDMLRLNQTNKVNQCRNKIRQAKLKVTSDSMDYVAANVQYDIAEKQFERQETLYSKGLRSLTELEARKLKLQETLAKKIAQENKWLVSKNELTNAIIELGYVNNEFAEKMAKTTSEKFSASSDQFEAKATLSKLKNQYSNYRLRSSFYYIVAPQDCYITKALTKGLGETVKEGEPVVSIMPAHARLATEMYVDPYDMPLIQIGENVRLEFDGWPTIIFSGWPQFSFGTFGGKVVAIDNAVSENGKFRILVGEDPDQTPWPHQIRVGTGCNGLALLNDVPVWWEIWRKINSFPPDFYTNPLESKSKDDKKKSK